MDPSGTIPGVNRSRAGARTSYRYACNVRKGVFVDSTRQHLTPRPVYEEAFRACAVRKAPAN